MRNSLWSYLGIFPALYQCKRIALNKFSIHHGPPRNFPTRWQQAGKKIKSCLELRVWHCSETRQLITCSCTVRRTDEGIKTVLLVQDDIWQRGWKTRLLQHTLFNISSGRIQETKFIPLYRQWTNHPSLRYRKGGEDQPTCLLRFLPSFPYKSAPKCIKSVGSHIVTFLGSPPNVAMYFCTHWRANRSNMSMLLLIMLRIYCMTHGHIGLHLQFQLLSLPFHLGIRMLDTYQQIYQTGSYKISIPLRR